MWERFGTLLGRFPRARRTSLSTCEANAACGGQRFNDTLSHLRALERYFGKTGIAKLSELTPRLITEFLTTRARQIHARQLGGYGSVLRVFLRYLHREGILAKRSESYSASRPRLPERGHSTGDPMERR